MLSNLIIDRFTTTDRGDSALSTVLISFVSMKSDMGSNLSIDNPSKGNILVHLPGLVVNAW